MPGAIALVLLFVARLFGATSIVAIAAYTLALVVPGLWIGGTWLWDHLWHRVDRVLVMPFVRRSGAPDVARMAIARSEAFADVYSSERAVEEWSSSAQHRSTK